MYYQWRAMHGQRKATDETLKIAHRARVGIKSIILSGTPDYNEGDISDCRLEMRLINTGETMVRNLIFEYRIDLDGILSKKAPITASEGPFDVHPDIPFERVSATLRDTFSVPIPGGSLWMEEISAYPGGIFIRMFLATRFWLLITHRSRDRESRF
jgi:hypothetical protein